MVQDMRDIIETVRVMMKKKNADKVFQNCGIRGTMMLATRRRIWGDPR